MCQIAILSADLSAYNASGVEEVRFVQVQLESLRGPTL
jgi:hypothetical protein